MNEIKVLVGKITSNTEQMNKLYAEALEATRNADVAGACVWMTSTTKGEDDKTTSTTLQQAR